MQRLGRLVATFVLVASVVALSSSTAGACSLAMPFVFVDSADAQPGGELVLDSLLYEIVDDADVTTSTSTTSAGEPTIEQCPPTSAVDQVVFRFVQGGAATDLVTVEPAAERFRTTVSIPSTALAGPARIVASVDGQAVTTSEVLTVVRPSSPPAPPTVEAPDFTG